jgi:hypothetical protein
VIQYPIKQIHNISRPGEDPAPGDVIEIETTGGYIMQVDPKTRKNTDTPKRFTVGLDGALSF